MAPSHRIRYCIAYMRQFNQKKKSTYLLCSFNHSFIDFPLFSKNSQQALGVYGPALKEIIHEEFGDGIVSAIDFNIKVERENDPAGDRCRLIWSGKFLPYKKF